MTPPRLTVVGQEGEARLALYPESSRQVRRLPTSCAVQPSSLAGEQRNGPGSPQPGPPLSSIPTEGAAALTTVEARGTSSPRGIAAVSGTRADAARAAGAQLTGQRQDGPSQGPAHAAAPSAISRVAEAPSSLTGVSRVAWDLVAASLHHDKEV
jgi:hypothetical protein